MNIYVSRDGQTFGPYSKEQAKGFVDAGQLLTSDFALFEGETEWKTLGLIIGVNEPQTAPIVEIQDPQKPSSQIQKKNAISANTVKKVRMNRGQAKVIVKERGTLSKIISTLIVFGVTCLLVFGAVIGLYFAFPKKVSPILSKFGISFEETATKEILKANTKIIKEPINPVEMTLNDDELQRLRSTNVILLATEKEDGFRVLSPVDKDLGLSDDDLEALIPISNQILTLDLTYAEITDSGLQLISKFTNLERLYLEGNKRITLDGITKLKDLQNLSYLNLVRVELDEGLVDLLISMENLREIYLFETGLNKGAISRLSEKRPKVFVNDG